jgi:uncharacterized protein
VLDIPSEDPLSVAVVSAIRDGEVHALRRLLDENPGLATVRIINAKGVGRTLLHVATDWPGHFPNGAKTIAALVAAGADVDAAVSHPAQPAHRETPLHWAASCDDVEALDALLEAGANIEAPGAIFTGGAPMSDAVVFAQWNAARRLLERGARTTFWQAAALGLLDRVRDYCENTQSQPPPSGDEITNAFWNACRGGQKPTAEYLLGRGADLNWIGYDRVTPLDAAQKSGNEGLVNWLRGLGAKSIEELE